MFATKKEIESLNNLNNVIIPKLLNVISDKATIQKLSGEFKEKLSLKFILKQFKIASDLLSAPAIDKNCQEIEDQNLLIQIFEKSHDIYYFTTTYVLNQYFKYIAAKGKLYFLKKEGKNYKHFKNQLKQWEKRNKKYLSLVKEYHSNIEPLIVKYT